MYYIKNYYKVYIIALNKFYKDSEFYIIFTFDFVKLKKPYYDNLLFKLKN